MHADCERKPIQWFHEPRRYNLSELTGVPSDRIRRLTLSLALLGQREQIKNRTVYYRALIKLTTGLWQHLYYYLLEWTHGDDQEVICRYICRHIPYQCGQLWTSVLAICLTVTPQATCVPIQRFKVSMLHDSATTALALRLHSM